MQRDHVDALVVNSVSIVAGQQRQDPYRESEEEKVRSRWGIAIYLWPTLNN